MAKKPLRLEVITGDCAEVMRTMERNGEFFDCVFADPPDNLDLDYGTDEDGNKIDDDLELAKYLNDLQEWFLMSCRMAPCVWWSFNSRHTIPMAVIADDFLKRNFGWQSKTCVQTFTFGQYRETDLANNHRHLWRFRIPEKAPLYNDSIRIESQRMKDGDPRAKGLRVPGDVFDFPRVVGNSKQRRKWHKTQLHEDLVERAIKQTTVEGDWVLDPFGGTGTTLRVCKRIGRHCTIIEKNPVYADKICEENDINREV